MLGEARVLRVGGRSEGEGEGFRVRVVLSEDACRELLVGLDRLDALLDVPMLLVAPCQEQPVFAERAVDVGVLLEEPDTVCDLGLLPRDEGADGLLCERERPRQAVLRDGLDRVGEYLLAVLVNLLALFVVEFPAALQVLALCCGHRG